ncbi:MAG: macro domain-containing protein [Eubacterium sp.]|nr:macro domain-containing protein [Eubacterium sp.]
MLQMDTNNKQLKDIAFITGNIADKQELDAREIDTIINAAKPTLMGSKQGVDGAIHKAINDIEGEDGYFKKKICEELKTGREENLIRCQRGDAVLTSGEGLCRYVIHVVGAQYDGKPGGFFDCSSSAVQTLESCYYNIVRVIKEHPDIQNVGIPIISSGEYGFPFQMAAKIAVASIYNAILEWKQQDPEIFELSSLKKIYFFVYDKEHDNREKKLQDGKEILKSYAPIMAKEKRVVFQSSYKAHLRYWKEIIDYDKTRGYFSVAKSVRKLLMMIRLFFLPVMIFKDKCGGEDWEKRRQFVERLAIGKAGLPILFYLAGKMQIIAGCSVVNDYIFPFLIAYNMIDTITYLLTLVIMADIQSPSANIIRSMIMLFVNYIEVSLGMSYLCLKCNKGLSLKEALDFGVLNQITKGMVNAPFIYVNAGIKFFFITLVFGYLANHMRPRKFRS